MTEVAAGPKDSDPARWDRQAVCVAVLALVLGLPLTHADGGVRAFGYLAGAGGLSIVLIYLAVNIAAIRAFRTEFRDQFRLWRHLLVPATASVTSSGSGGICSSRQRPPYCSCFPCGGSFIPVPAQWRTCCPSRRSGGSAWGPSPPASCAPGGRRPSRLWAEYSCQPQTARGPSRPAGVDPHHGRAAACDLTDQAGVIQDAPSPVIQGSLR